MAKIKKLYLCNNCGYQTPKWLGKCPSCNEWNTIVEEIVTKETKQEQKSAAWSNRDKKSTPIPLKDIQSSQQLRIVTPDDELNRTLGGGIVLGAVVLIGGQPGIGKSTLLLQLATRMNKKILYVSGEESEEQIKMRADRIGIKNENCFISSENNIVKLLKASQELQPELLVIDSIQTVMSPHIDSTAGSISQVRECAGELQRYAKETNTPVFIIGHINKDGAIAGPKLLEHIVDVVLQFEGDQHYSYRILRTLKNRFGSTDELGIYAMESGGLREVENPSELLISQGNDELSGSSIAASIEGLRPMMIETQALVTASVYGTPQRSATGFDLRRLSMLLAVLEKRCGLGFGMTDVFLNIVGGIKVADPSIDLAIVSALISSLNDIAVPKKVCFAGEVGLSGEIRAVGRVEQRIQEAERLGYEKIYISKYNKGIKKEGKQIKIVTIGKVEDLLHRLFEE